MPDLNRVKNQNGMGVYGQDSNAAMLDMLAETDSPPSVRVPQKFTDELNQFREIRSREEFLELTRPKVEPERREL